MYGAGMHNGYFESIIDKSGRLHDDKPTTAHGLTAPTTTDQEYVNNLKLEYTSINDIGLDRRIEPLRVP